MGGSFDLWGSRRINFEYCEWYERDEKATKDLSKLVYNKKPTAIFYAKETSAESRQKQELGGLFLGDESTIQIVTQDDVEGIKGVTLLSSVARCGTYPPRNHRKCTSKDNSLIRLPKPRT